MEKLGAADRPTLLRTGLKHAVRSLPGLLIAVLLLFAVTTLTVAGPYLGYLAAKATVVGAWDVLSISSALMSVIAIAGTGFALFRRKMIPALAVAAIALPAHLVMEASRCDTASSCRAIGWAGLPSSVLNWEVRIRPVTEPNEARKIALEALSKSGSDDSLYKAKRFGDHWIVSTIDQDGWPGSQAIKIDTRTGQTSLIDCPAERIQCGMERPIRSDGRRQFRNDQLGLAAAFPVSLPVCTSRGEHEEARGFYAVVRPADVPCDVVDHARRMGVEVARSRKRGCRSVEAPSAPWRSLSPETAKLFRNGAPSLGGRPSVVCELRMDGHIQISVYAAATPPSNTAGKGALYEGYIVTTPAFLTVDIRSFEAFLNSVSIGRLATK